MHMWPCVHGHGRRTYHDTTLKQNRAPTALVPLRGRPWMLVVHCSYCSNTSSPPFNPARRAPARSRWHIGQLRAHPMAHRLTSGPGPVRPVRGKRRPGSGRALFAGSLCAPGYARAHSARPQTGALPSGAPACPCRHSASRPEPSQCGTATVVTVALPHCDRSGAGRGCGGRDAPGRAARCESAKARSRRAGRGLKGGGAVLG